MGKKSQQRNSFRSASDQITPKFAVAILFEMRGNRYSSGNTAINEIFEVVFWQRVNKEKRPFYTCQ